MKLSTSIIARLGIVGLVAACAHLISSIWWTLFTLKEGYDNRGGWSILGDYLMGGFYRGLDFRFALIGTVLGVIMFVTILILGLTALAIVVTFLYWLMTGKNPLRNIL